MTTDKSIQILDGFLTEKEADLIGDLTRNGSWRFGWPKERRFNERPCWHMFIAGKHRPKRQSCEDELRDNALWGFLLEVWRRAKATCMQDCTLIGVYANGQTFPQDSPIHRDVPKHEQGKTLLLFGNQYWSTSWGGELVFYDSTKTNIVESVMPKPNRAVVFDAKVPHNARSPTIDCRELRVTIAFKSIIKEGENG